MAHGEPNMAVPPAEETTYDTRSSFDSSPPIAEVQAAINHDDITPSDDDDDKFLPMPMPVHTRGPTPFAYERALLNRIRRTKLLRSGDYDTHTYTPTFLHDTLMLPGTLASLLSKPSPSTLLNRLTPALLPGFQAHIHPQTHEPCLLPSADPAAYVQGMMLFGTGKRGRELVHGHYGPRARRVKVQAEIDVVVPEVRLSADGCSLPRLRWKLQRRRVWALAWVWADVSVAGEGRLGAVAASRWTVEGFLGGSFDSRQTLRIEADGKGDERDDDVDDVRCGGEGYVGEGCEIPRSGYGHLDYARTEGFSGW